MSLKAWKFFKVYLQESHQGSLPDGFSCFIPVPTADDFTVYTEPLQSNSTFDFVSHVRLCGTSQIKAHDLVRLTSLNNLGILEIMEPPDQRLPFPRVNDRLIRTWSEETDPFPSLKILRILSLSLTEQSLPYVSTFPQLCLYEATGPYSDWPSGGRALARELGWVHCDPHEAYEHFLERNDNLRLGRPWDFPTGETMLLPLTGYVESCRPEFRAAGSLGRLNWAYWLYDGLHRTPLRIDERQTRQLLSTLNAQETYRTAELMRPMATLSLGKNAIAAEPSAHISGPHPVHAKAYFWRYWLPDGETALNAHVDVVLGPQPGYTRHPRPQPRPKEEPLKRPAKDGTTTTTTRSRKQRRAEGAYQLREFLGDYGRR